MGKLIQDTFGIDEYFGLQICAAVETWAVTTIARRNSWIDIRTNENYMDTGVEHSQGSAIYFRHINAQK